LSFTLTQVGQYQVSVTFRGKHLQGSPFTLEVMDRPVYRRDYSKVSDQAVSQFGSQGSGDGQFQRPYSVVCNLRGDIVVTGRNNQRVQVFDRNGKFLFKFGSKGNGNGQFDRPCGVTVDQRNNQIVVADTWNNRIQIFDEKGTFLRKFGSYGKGDGQFRYPFGIVVDQQGNYVVTDCSNHRIHIFNSQGQFIRKFGSEGTGNGQMNGPVGVGLLSNGNIVVADDNNRVQIFDFEGNFVRIVGAGQVRNPWHLFVDSDENILVADNAIIAFKCSTKMAITSKPLDQGRFQTLVVFAWTVREGLL